MAEQTTIETPETVGKSTRRAFVKNSAQVAITAPAVTLLLNATTKSAAAQITAYNACCNRILDDFTTGNTQEDIDAGPSLDDIT